MVKSGGRRLRTLLIVISGPVVPLVPSALERRLCRGRRGIPANQHRSGPGFLAEYILSRCPFLETYTLLDFSHPMLNMSQKRLETFGARVSFLQTDFKADGWVHKAGTLYDAIVSIQAVHELRHKRH